MLVNELFEALDKAVKFKTDEQEGYFKASFTVNGRKIEFIADKTSDLGWSLEFAEVTEKKSLNGMAYSSFTFKKTQSGGEFQVFATIKEIISYFIKLEKPQMMYFTSVKEDKSRAKLYHTLTRKFKPPGYTLSINPEELVDALGDDEEFFAFTKD